MNHVWSAESSAISVRVTFVFQKTTRGGPGSLIVALVNPQPSPASPWSVKFTEGRLLLGDITGATALAVNASDEGPYSGADASAARRRIATDTSVGPRISPLVIPPRSPFLQLTTF